MIGAIREAYQEAARVQDWHRQGQGIDNHTGWRHSTTGSGIDCLFVGTDCLCGLGSRSEPHTGGADHRRDRPTAPQPPAMASVEMRYLTNAARHRQTIQRMLDNGVEVVVAVRKDGVPPWCRRICPLHSLRLGVPDSARGSRDGRGIAITIQRTVAEPCSSVVYRNRHACVVFQHGTSVN